MHMFAIKVISLDESTLQIVEPFTAHYVFALGVARFLGFAHWIIQVVFSVFPVPVMEHGTCTACAFRRMEVSRRT